MDWRVGGPWELQQNTTRKTPPAKGKEERATRRKRKDKAKFSETRGEIIVMEKRARHERPRSLNSH